MATVQACFYCLNYALCDGVYGSTDPGGTIYIHLFGGVFGVFTSWCYRNPKTEKDQKNAHSSFHSNLYSLLGTMFLWMYWPSFNSALLDGNSKHRAIVNTTYSMSCSTIGCLLTSMFLHKGKMNAEQIINGSLAGGIMIGASCDMIVSPFISLIIGFSGGILSTLGIHFLEKPFYKFLYLHDTAAIAWVHMLPGFVGGLISALIAGVTPEREYGVDL